MDRFNRWLLAGAVAVLAIYTIGRGTVDAIVQLEEMRHPALTIPQWCAQPIPDPVHRGR